jgi:nucleotide-binding universal stress UspA family protein
MDFISMIKTILIPTDGSEGSRNALDYGIYISAKLNTLISGLHVLDVNLLQGPMLTDISGAVGIPPYDGFFDAVHQSLSEKADFIINDFREQCLRAGLKTEIKKVIGKIDEIIIEEASTADFILMARKGEHFHLKKGGLLGSVAEAVIRHSGKPVMITPDKYREIESMGIAYDGSPSARKALEFSLGLSKQAAWPLTAVIITDNMEKATTLTIQIEEAAHNQENECEVIILRGKEAMEIIKFIQEDAVELMVMGAYGHNRLRELLLGSTTAQVIQKSTIPVLLMR